jgi:hypothetical protein
MSYLPHILSDLALMTIAKPSHAIGEVGDR